MKLIFWTKLLLTGRHVSSLRKPNTKLSKRLLSEIMQLDEFLDKQFGPRIKISLSFIKIVLTALSKSVVIPL